MWNYPTVNIFGDMMGLFIIPICDASNNKISGYGCQNPKFLDELMWNYPMISIILLEDNQTFINLL